MMPQRRVCLAHRHPLCRASLRRASRFFRRWTKRLRRRTDWDHKRGSTTGETWLSGGCRLSKEFALVLRYPPRFKGPARSPFCLTLRATQAETRDRSRSRSPEAGSDGMAVYRIDRPRSCKGGPPPEAGQTLPSVHHDTVTSRYEQSWDTRATVFTDLSCTPARWLCAWVPLRPPGRAIHTALFEPQSQPGLSEWMLWTRATWRGLLLRPVKWRLSTWIPLLRTCGRTITGDCPSMRHPMPVCGLAEPGQSTVPFRNQKGPIVSSAAAISS